MERVLDDLEQIHFSMKKANQVLRDMTRGIATDRRARRGGIGT
jgi:SNARE protein